MLKTLITRLCNLPQINRRPTTWIVVLAASVALSGTGMAPWSVDTFRGHAHAQATKQYKEIQARSDREGKSLSRTVKSIMRTPGAPSAEDKAALQNYYVNYIIASMTRADRQDDPERFPSWRNEIAGELERAPSAKHDFVRSLIFRYTKGLAESDQYRPAARYNALLILGELNEREERRQGGTLSLAVPYAQARPTLIKLATDTNEDQLLRVGALIGLARHAKLLGAIGQPDARTIGAFVSVMREETPSNGGTMDGLNWMKKLCVEGLGDSGQAGAAKLLEPVLNDEDAPLYLRCAAADALGRLDYRSAQGLDYNSMLSGMNKLMVDSLKEQLVLLQDYVKENPVSPLGGGFEGRVGGVDENPEEHPVTLRVRRQLKAHLKCVADGMSGLSRANTDAATQQKLTAMQSELRALNKELDVENLPPNELLEKISQPAVRIEALAQN